MKIEKITINLELIINNGIIMLLTTLAVSRVIFDIISEELVFAW